MAVVARITASKALEAARFVESDSAGAYVHNHLARDYSTWRPPRTWTGYGDQYAQGRSTIVVAPDGTVAEARYNVRATGHVASLRKGLGLD